MVVFSIHNDTIVAILVQIEHLVGSQIGVQQLLAARTVHLKTPITRAAAELQRIEVNPLSCNAAKAKFSIIAWNAGST